MQVCLVDGSAWRGWKGQRRQGREGEAHSGTMSSGHLKHWALERAIRPERSLLERDLAERGLLAPGSKAEGQ